SNEDIYQVTKPAGILPHHQINTYSAGSGEEERKGSERDVDRRSMTSSMRQRSPQELAKHGSFVCFLMAHGRKDQQGRDCNYRWAMECRAFRLPRPGGKQAKIFFVQACRGSGTDEVTHRGWQSTSLPQSSHKNPPVPGSRE
uniref:CASPASE_P20 domain-containing protein n=1 Tax=Macrostomum lignano TaxID=282301 RepID=A0A1I8FLC4_9PLAT